MRQGLTEDPARQARAVVFGAGGAIGAALVEALAADARVCEIHACARRAPDLESQTIAGHCCDITSDAELARVAAEVGEGGPVDLVIVATGILHDGADVAPEKSMGDIDARRMEQVFRINTFGPALVAKHFLPLLRKQQRNVFAALSARVGSIGDNRLGGWISYRASKAALNMVVKTLSIEQRRKNPESIVVALHPGTVDSRLSAPFQSGVAEDKLFTPGYAAAQLLDVIDGLTPDDTGYVYAWDGKRIDY